MANIYSRRSRRRQHFSSTADWLGALALLVLTGFVFVSSFSTNNEQAHATIPMPGNTDANMYQVYANPLAVLDTQKTSAGLVAAAVAHGQDEIPEVPWGDHGLSDVAIDMSEVIWDPQRHRYIQHLPTGETAVLTLDRKTQRRLVNVTSRYSEPGQAAVAIEPQTGRIAAMVSEGEVPRMDRRLARDATAWAASTFKVMTAASLLEHQKANPETKTCYHGGGGGFTEDLLRDNPELDTLCLTLRRALALSANVVFGKLADRYLTPEALTETAESFMFNRSLPLEVDIARSRVQLPKNSLQFAQSAAGFRYTKMSPLHGAMIQATIANEGTMMVPALVERIEDSEGHVIWEHEPVVWDQVLTPQQAQALKNIESETCVNGTARKQFEQRRGWPNEIKSWGKTGTLSNQTIDGSQPDPAYIYSWFTGFSSNGGRQIAVAGLVVQDPTWEIKGAYLASEAALGYLHGRPGEEADGE